MLRIARLAGWLLAAVLLAVQSLLGGLDPFAIVMAGLLILIGFAVEGVETRTQRPLKTYLRVALASAVAALLLIVMPLLIGGALWIGLILWAGLSAAALVWCIHYERTEPL
jgi:hypothetical protein